MDNQQERAILSLEFIAGLIVGEGSYSLNVHRPKNGLWEFKPSFSLRMNDVETIDRVCESFAAHGLALYRSPGVYKRCHAIRVDGIKRMRTHLDVFLPLLTGNKLKAAQVTSEFIDHRLSRPPKSKYTEADIQFIVRLREINGPSGVRLPIEILRDHMRKPDMRGMNMRLRRRSIHESQMHLAVE